MKKSFKIIQHHDGRDKPGFLESGKKLMQESKYMKRKKINIYNFKIISILRTDVCESKLEVSTPFWASNSNGKVRAILNNKEFEQAVHQEICT